MIAVTTRTRQTEHRRYPGVSLRRDSPPVEDTSDALTSIEIFSDLADAEVQELVGDVPTRTVAKGALLYAADEGPAEFYLLQSGMVELFRQSASGKKLTLGIVQQGTFFGEMSILGQHQAGTGAIAIEDSVVYALSCDQAQLIMLEHPVVASVLWRCWPAG